MRPLRIFVDFAAPSEILGLLREETAGHDLVFAEKPASSILVSGRPDPGLSGADVAFGQPDPQAIAECPEMKWVHVSSSGITRYDTPEFRSLAAGRGMVVSNSAGVYAEACAVHLLSFMLAQARTLPGSLKIRTANGSADWNQLRSSCRTLRGETALFIGYGAIGRRLVELLRPLDLKLFAYRRKARGDEGIPVVDREQLGKLTLQADHVLNILPENQETRRFFDVARFSEFKPGAVFYNIGRGATVDQDALLQALRSGHLRAAWLDVTDPEPLPDTHPLWAEPNCFITPHLAGGQAEETKALVRHFLDNLNRFVRAEPLLDRVL